MEVAGLVLGAVPIFVSILKQYGTLRKICKRIKLHKAGVEELQRSLKSQKAIFVNETRILLSSVVGTYQAKQMVNDADCPYWNDVGVGDRLNEILGDNQRELCDIANEVSAQTMRLIDEIKRCEGSKVKFSLAESKLDKLCKSLRECTQDYCTLRKQIQELATSKPIVESPSVRKTDAARLRATQAAAKHVYEALVAACSLHSAHHAHISLKPIYSCDDTDTEIKFQIAYRHLTRQQLKGSDDVLWFMVESVISGTIIHITPATTPSMSGKTLSKRPRSPSFTAVQEATSINAKRVRFAPTSGPSQRIIMSPSRSQSVSSTLPDLCTTADLCRQLLKCCQGNHASGTCVGLLSNSKHKVYHTDNPCRQTTRGQSDAKALTELLLQAQQDHAPLPYKSLSELQRLRLARLLSSAMMNFYSTPWMQNSWRSDDIFLYNSNNIVGTSSTALDLEPEAFVEVLVNEEDQVSSQNPQRSFDIPEVRNSTLFSLGVILLELAFGKPLFEMRKPCDCRRPGMSAVERDYWAARRLSKQATGMGVKMAKMIEQCLFCDFGHGAELENPALQDAVHRDVVSELDTLIQGMSYLHT